MNNDMETLRLRARTVIYKSSNFKKVYGNIMLNNTHLKAKPKYITKTQTDINFAKNSPERFNDAKPVLCNDNYGQNSTF